MDLSDFISESITEITEGLLQAQKQVSKHGVDIRTAGGDTGYSEIEFDVAVTARHTKDLGGKAKLSVLGIGLELGKDGDKTTGLTSRIKFSVELSIPEEQMKLAAAGKGKKGKA